MLRLHPWCEIALAASLVCLGGALGLVAALVAVGLMSVYLALVWRVARRRDEATCACFGASQRVTGVTVARNAWLTILAIATASVIWAGPPIGGAAATVVARNSGWGALLTLVVSAITVALVLWPDTAQVPTASVPAPAAAAGASDGDALEYVRTRTPAVPVTLADGTVVNLRALAEHKPLLLLAVSETCGACAPVIRRAPQWRVLLPEVDVRILLRMPPEDSGITERAEPQSLHDVPGYVSGSIADWMTPTAVLLGSDGMLAGGPEMGVEAIEVFVQDIRAALDGTV
ncbi:hypothetical protein LG315_10845 [Microbacterium marinum]